MKITKDTIATLTAPNFLLEDTIDEIQQFLLKIVGNSTSQTEALVFEPLADTAVIYEGQTANRNIDTIEADAKIDIGTFLASVELSSAENKPKQSTENKSKQNYTEHTNTDTGNNISRGRYRKSKEWIINNCETVYKLLERGLSTADISEMLGEDRQYIYGLLLTEDDFSKKCKSIISNNENVSQKTTNAMNEMAVIDNTTKPNRSRRQSTIDWIENNKYQVYMLIESGWTFARISRFFAKQEYFIKHLVARGNDDFALKCRALLNKRMSK